MSKLEVFSKSSFYENFVRYTQDFFDEFKILSIEDARDRLRDVMIKLGKMGLLSKNGIELNESEAAKLIDDSISVEISKIKGNQDRETEFKMTVAENAALLKAYDEYLNSTSGGGKRRKGKKRKSKRRSKKSKRSSKRR